MAAPFDSSHRASLQQAYLRRSIHGDARYESTPASARAREPVKGWDSRQGSRCLQWMLAARRIAERDQGLGDSHSYGSHRLLAGAALHPGVPRWRREASLHTRCFGCAWLRPSGGGSQGRQGCGKLQRRGRDSASSASVSRATGISSACGSLQRFAPNRAWLRR